MRSLSALALIGFLAPLVRAGNVLVVDPSGAAGTHPEIQSAVSAASDGDVVLVKTGTYPTFTIANKDVSVVADTGAVVQVTGTVRVMLLAATRCVLISGLDITGAYGTTNNGHGLVASSNAGSVRVEHCVIHAAPGTADFCLRREGAFVETSADVAFAHSTIVGTDAASLFYVTGGYGLRCVGSNVAVYDCTLRGGHGGNSSTCSFMNCAYVYAVDTDGADGGIGLRIESSQIFVSRSSVGGGDGGNALPNPNYGTYGGCGGAGAELVSATSSHRLDGMLAGGAPGLSLGASPASPGPVLAYGSAPFPLLAGTGRTLAASAVVRENNAIALTLSGQPNDAAGVLVSTRASHHEELAVNGVYLTAAPTNGRFFPLGPVPGAGTLASSVTIGDLGPGVQARRFFVQSFHQEPGGRVVLGTPETVIVLDSAYSVVASSSGQKVRPIGG